MWQSSSGIKCSYVCVWYCVVPIFEPFVFNLLEATNKHLFIWTEEITLKEDIVVDSSIREEGRGFFCFPRETKSENERECYADGSLRSIGTIDNLT